MPEYPAQTWSSVIERYRRLAVANPYFAPMRDLVERIAASRYASGLHPLVSMQTLRLSPRERFNLQTDEVRIDCENGEFVVRYQGGPAAAIWTKRDPDGFAAFERFLEHIRWFVDYRGAPSNGPAA